MLTQEDLNAIEKIVKKAIVDSVSGGALRAPIIKKEAMI